MAQSSTPSAQQTSPKAPAGGLAPGAPPLQLQSLPPDEHTLTPAEQAQVQREQAYRTALRVAKLTARWGPAMSTPGVSITLVQTARTKTPSGATQFTYQIAGSGFRAGEKLNLVRWPLGGPMNTEMGGLVLNAKGIAVCGASANPAPAPPAEGRTIAPAPSLSAAPVPQTASAPVAEAPSCADTMKLNQPVEIQTSAAPGEPIRVALIGEDRSNGAATQTVPFPIANTDKSCSLQVLLGLKNADMVILEGQGFPPNSSLKIETSTNNQRRTLTAQTDAGGHMAMVILPAVPGQTTGTITVRYAGALTRPSAATPATPAGTATPAATDAGCAPAVTFPWGPGSYKRE